MSYEIQTRVRTAPSEWRDDEVGIENEFETEEAAVEAIEFLRALGGEWDEAVVEYRVVER